MARTVQKRPAIEHELTEDRATFGAALYLTVFLVIALVGWGALRDVLLPTRNTIRFGALVSGAAIATTCLLHRPRRRRWWRNGAYALALGAAVVGMGLLPSHVEVDLRAHDAELTAVALARLHADPSGTSGCIDARVDPAGDLGPFDSTCVIGIPPHFAVEFSHTLDATHTDGLIYAPGSSGVQPTATCIGHLYGPWFRFARPADPNCPFGLGYTGAG